MAEFDGLDGRLRDALGRAAEPGDSTGVADAIRTRVAAGDPGTSVAGATAPGWGGSPWSWIPWLGLVVVAGIGGGAVGATGILMPPTSQATVVVVSETGSSVDGAACPEGPVSGSIPPGSRVLAVARSDDGTWLGVRDPSDYARTLWFDRDIVILDGGGADIGDLPVEACPEPVVALGEPTPEPTVEPTEEPAPGPGPGPQPGDTTPPSIVQTAITGNGCPYEVQAVATDNVGVTSASVSWTGLSTGSNEPMTFSGGTWRYTYIAPDPSYGTVTFTITVRDADGNATAAVVSRNDMGCIG